MGLEPCGAEAVAGWWCFADAGSPGIKSSLRVGLSSLLLLLIAQGEDDKCFSRREGEREESRCFLLFVVVKRESAAARRSWQKDRCALFTVTPPRAPPGPEKAQKWKAPSGLSKICCYRKPKSRVLLFYYSIITSQMFLAGYLIVRLQTKINVLHTVCIRSRVSPYMPPAKEEQGPRASTHARTTG